MPDILEVQLPSLQGHVEAGGTAQTYFETLDSHRRLLASIIGVSEPELHEMGPEAAKTLLDKKQGATT